MSSNDPICDKIDEYNDLYDIISEGIDYSISGISSDLYFNHNAGVNEVARQLGVSKTYISKCFNREFKMSFRVYKKLVEYHDKLHKPTLA